MRWAAVRVLHPGHRDAGEVAGRQEGHRPRPPGDGAAPRRPPLPVHRLRQDPRRHRGRRQGQVVPTRARRWCRRVGREVRGRAARPRRPQLRRRHPRAGHAPRRPPVHRTRPRRRRRHRHLGGGRGRRCRLRAHRRRHPRRAAGGDHPQGLADHDPRRRAHVVRRRRAGDRRRFHPSGGARRGGARRGLLRRAGAGDRPGGGDRAGCTGGRVGHGRQRPVAQLLRPRRRRGRAGRQRAQRARGVPDPAHRARLPRAGVVARRPVGVGRRPDAARVLRRAGRVGRPRRHLSRARPADRPGHCRAGVERRRLRRQGGYEQPGPGCPGGVAARPAGEVHALARGELPAPRQAPSDPPRVLGRLRRVRHAHRGQGAGGRRLRRVRCPSG